MTPLQRILIVDDEESFRLVCMEILRATDRYDVVTCGSGEEAVAILREEMLDAVVLDHHLGGMSGLNVLQWMHEQKMETPVIMLTGAGSESLAAECMKLGAYDYIPKELYDRHHFPVVVQSVIERHGFRKERERRETVERDHDRTLQSLDVILGAVASLEQTINNTLALIAATLDQRRGELTALLAPEQRPFVDQICTDLKHQYDMLAIVNKTFAQLTRSAMSTMQHVHGVADPSSVAAAAMERVRAVLKRLNDPPTEE